MAQNREQLGSRLGFLLIAAGCAIGLGNVWRFPFITGAYGGAAFVLIYLLFLVILGLPVLTMEFAIGRAAQRGIGQGLRILEPSGSKWHIYGYFGTLGCVMLMMFYTTVTGWMLAYCKYSIAGDLAGLEPAQIGAFFGNLLQDPYTLIGWMGLAIAIGSGVCAMGLQSGVERVTKVMMSCLLFIMIVLVGRSVTLDGAAEGLKFYLMPDFGRMMEQGFSTVVFAAMGQAFFTLSIGIGAMAIFGSYIGKNHSLTGESIRILSLDTMVALMAGLIIFPACSAFGVDVNAGPGLIFVTLPNVFNAMPMGNLWGSLFFVFMSFAALTTVIAVMECIIAYAIDGWGWSRKKAALTCGMMIFVLSIPCALGFNVWSSFAPLGEGTIVLDLEDFIVSNNLLPLGSMVFLFFCCSRYGWGWNNFIKEVDAGQGLRFPKGLRFYVTYILPAIVFAVFAQGYYEKFFK
ncbi:MAG: sodium-dependent transporter [Pseudomonadota bacterium]